MKFLREPLVQFLALGALLFGVFRVMGNWNVEKPQQIVVSPNQIDALVKGFELDFKHSPNSQEIDKLIQDYVREEVMVREAEKLQMQRDDQAIRRLMHARMESYNQDQAKLSLPTDQQLQEFYDKHPDLFTDKSKGTLPGFEEAKSTVRSVWLATVQKAARDAAYELAKTHYNIVIQMPQAPTSAPAK